MKFTNIFLFLFVLPLLGFANIAPRDTLTIELKNKTKVILVTKENVDLSELTKYDFNKMIRDLVETKKQHNDELEIIQIEDRNGILYRVDSTQTETNNWDEPLPNHNHHAQPDVAEMNNRKRVRSESSLIFDFGINNWLENGKFPNDSDKQYAVKNWGSWQVSLGFGQDIIFGDYWKKPTFILRTGFDISWYNLKFVDPATLIKKENGEIKFVQDDDADKNYEKSKLTTSYLNFRLIPMFANKSFRFGLGAYGGVLLSNHTKVKYTKDGDDEKDKDKSSLYINTWRYGLRGEIGYRSILFYTNYDLNPLFAKSRAPELHAISFGFSLFFN